MLSCPAVGIIIHSGNKMVPLTYLRVTHTQKKIEYCQITKILGCCSLRLLKWINQIVKYLFISQTCCSNLSISLINEWQSRKIRLPVWLILDWCRENWQVLMFWREPGTYFSVKLQNVASLEHCNFIASTLWRFLLLCQVVIILSATKDQKIKKYLGLTSLS